MVHVTTPTGGGGPVSARIRLGTAPLGNLYGAVSDSEANKLLSAAEVAGFRDVDTAPLYGHGLSEVRIGRYLHDRPGSLTISTKVGRTLAPCNPGEIPDHGFVDPRAFAPTFDYSRDGILRSFGESLERLGVDSVDILLLHDIGQLTHGCRHQAILRQAIDEALPTMVRLREAGRARRIGIGVNEVAIVEELLPTGLLDIVLLAGRYTLLDTRASDLFDRCLKHKVGILAAGVYNSGLLAGGSTFDYRDADAALLARRDEMVAICSRHGVPLAAAALAFPLAHPAVEQIVVGLRSAEEVAATVALLAAEIPDDLWPALGLSGFARC
jgi:D-threo-aldose 1-dehydrogenase